MTLILVIKICGCWQTKADFCWLLIVSNLRMKARSDRMQSATKSAWNTILYHWSQQIYSVVWTWSLMVAAIRSLLLRSAIKDCCSSASEFWKWKFVVSCWNLFTGYWFTFDVCKHFQSNSNCNLIFKLSSLVNSFQDFSSV